MRRRRLAGDDGARARGGAGGSAGAHAARPEPVTIDLTVLDDDADQEHDQRSGRRGAPDRGTGRPAHRVAWAVAAVAVVLAGSVVAASVLDGARTVDLTALAGGLDPLETPPRTAWSVPVDPHGGVVVAPGTVVTVGDRLTAYAVEDGRPVWRSQPLGDGTTCLPGPEEVARDVVVCLRPTSARGHVRLTTVRSDTGRTVGTRVAAVAGSAVEPVGEADVVRAWSSGRDVVVVREDAATGDVRWERRLEHDRATGARLAARVPQSDVALDVSRGVVAVVAPGVVATFTEDGEPIESGEIWTVVRMTDGRYVGTAYGSGTASVYGEDGEESFRFAGRALEASLTDGSAPGVLLANTFGGVAGVDAATGDTVWTLPVAAYRAVARVDGLAVLETESSYHAVDVETGEQHWALRLPDRARWPALTDGSSLVVTRAEHGRPPELVSVALEDGDVEWTWRVPEGVYHVFTARGRLFLLGDDRLTAVS
ncbi:PQQ-binding-like beta-propeller repeat protein [Cellulosimicrobium sp. NPDC057127]|uniref:outer membrane protein assembly factor BamB family protein n=1 Tax=Cellulosimicrobium sp. NPDC057127 TaxID=3346026 RepID=UPI00363CACD3